MRSRNYVHINAKTFPESLFRDFSVLLVSYHATNQSIGSYIEGLRFSHPWMNIFRKFELFLVVQLLKLRLWWF